MNITFHLCVCFFVFATISDVDQAESVGVSTEWENKNIAQRLAINSFNQVVVHKRSAKKQSTNRQPHRKQPKRKENKQTAEEVIRKIHKDALQKRNVATKLSKIRARKLTEFALNSNKMIVRLMKLDDGEIKSLTAKAYAVENITQTSADIILELVKKTVNNIWKSLSEAAKTIKELSKSYIGQFEAFANKNMNEIITANHKKFDQKKATLLFTNGMAKIKDIAAESGLCLQDAYNNAANIVHDIVRSGAVLLNDTVNKQIQKFEPLHSNYEKLENYIDFVSGGIIDLSKTSAYKYMEVATDCLGKLKEVVDKSDQTLEKFANTLYDMGEAYIKTHKLNKEIGLKVIDTVDTFHITTEKGFNQLLEYFKTRQDKLMTDCNKEVASIKGCSVETKEYCVVTEK